MKELCWTEEWKCQ